MYRTIDLAEHVKGEPFRYSHGWQPIIHERADFNARFPESDHLYRGVNSQAGFDATLRGEGGGGTFGKGIYFGDITTAQTYTGSPGTRDIDGRIVRAAIDKSANVKEIPSKIKSKGAAAIDKWADENGVDVATIAHAMTIVRNPSKLHVDAKPVMMSQSSGLYYRSQGYTMDDEMKKSITDLAQPQIFGGTPKKLKDGSVTPKPGGMLVDKIGAILANKDVDSLKAKKVAKLLAPFGVGTKATAYAMFSAGFGKSGGTTPVPNARLAQNGIKATDKLAATPARAAAAQELSWRAAFVIKSAGKMQGTLNTVADREVPKAVVVRAQLADGSLNYKRHEAARAGRLNAAARAGKVASQFGSDLVGWYLNPALNNESECIAADGNNFYASQGTVLGWPGAVHPNCGCVAGPAHENGAMVNDSVNHLMGSGAVAKVFKLKRKAS